MHLILVDVVAPARVEVLKLSGDPAAKLCWSLAPATPRFVRLLLFMHLATLCDSVLTSSTLVCCR